MMSPAKSALLVIDVQRGSFEANPPPYEADEVIERINSLTARARAAGVPVVFFRQVRPGTSIKPEKLLLDRRIVVEPQDVHLEKTTPDAFLRTQLGSLLASWGTQKLVICGYATEACIDSTTRSALAHGFSVLLVEDAHTTHDKDYASGALIRAHHNFVLSRLRSFGPVIETRLAGDVSFKAAQNESYD